MFMGKTGVGAMAAAAFLLAAPLVYAEEACYCLQNQNTDQLIVDCGQVKDAAGGVRHECNDFKTKNRKPVAVKDMSDWRVVEGGKMGCTPCKYVHPTLVIPRGG